MGGWWRWALVSPDGMAPSRMVAVSACVNLALHHKVQKFCSGTNSPRWSRKKGVKTVVVVVVVLCTYFFYRFLFNFAAVSGQLNWQCRTRHMQMLTWSSFKLMSEFTHQFNILHHTIHVSPSVRLDTERNGLGRLLKWNFLQARYPSRYPTITVRAPLKKWFQQYNNKSHNSRTLGNSQSCAGCWALFTSSYISLDK